MANYAQTNTSEDFLSHKISYAPTGDGLNFDQYQPQISELLINLNKHKGIGRRTEYSNKYGNVLNKASILSVAIESKNNDSIIEAAQKLIQAGSQLQNVSVKNLSDDGKMAVQIGQGVLNTGKVAHSLTTKDYIIHALSDTEFTSMTIEDLRNTLEL